MQKFRFIFLPFSAPYVKVYLLENGVCIAKKKTKVARKTLEPLYQQLLSFEESPQGKVLQVICINTLLNLSMPPIQFPLNDFQIWQVLPFQRLVEYRNTTVTHLLMTTK